MKQMTNKRNWIVACLLACLVASWVTSRENIALAQSQETVTLRMLSYNIHGLPELIVTNHGQYARIGDILAERRKQGTAPQIVAIQEGWDFSGTADTLIEHAQYPYVAHGSQAAGHLLTSGIHILSEFPIETIDQMSYSDCSSWDCQSTKGSVHIRVRIPGVPVPIDIYNTHLNSDPDTDPTATLEECKAVRMNQISELAAFIERTSISNSIVFAPGDFNSFPGSEEILWFYGSSMLQNVLQYCARSGNTCGNYPKNDLNEAIDHQFFRSGSDHGKRVQVKPVSYVRNFDEIFEGETLSDHLGLEVEYQIRL